MVYGKPQPDKLISCLLSLNYGCNANIVVTLLRFHDKILNIIFSHSIADADIHQYESLQDGHMGIEIGFP